jgi:hypothetical protein
MRAPLLAAALLLLTATLAGCGAAQRARPANTTSGPPEVIDPELLGPVNTPTSAPHRKLPPMRGCRVPWRTDREMDDIMVAGGVRCALAKRIAIRVSHWWGERCEVHCAEAYPLGLGYRCDAFSTGEASWAVDCRRGRRLVHMGIAG